MFDSLYVAAGEPFAGMSTFSITVVFVINFVAFLARGAIGIGAVAVTVAVTAWVMPAQHAVLLTLLGATLPQIPLMREGLRDSDWHVSRPLLAGLTISIVVGVIGFASMSSDSFGLVLGVCMTVLVLLDVSKIIDRFAPRMNLRSVWVAFGLALGAGLLAGLSGAGGLVLLSVYLRHACRDHVALRGTAIMLGGMILIWRSIITVLTGIVTLQLVTESLLLLPFVYGGVLVGRHFFSNLSPKGFTYLFQGALLASALGLTVDGVLKLMR